MIKKLIRKFHGEMRAEHHRYRSWEHCYRYFRQAGPKAIAADQDHAALHLGFYLASWGMYRGSGFLLRHSYTVHLGVVKEIVDPRFSALWECEFGGGDDDTTLVPQICDLISAIRKAYGPFASAAKSGQASDTLVTKVILGTLGCLPACDRYFIDGFKSAKFRYSSLTRGFVESVLQFCQENLPDLRDEQTRIERNGGIRYPLMKLVDMYFYQIGYDRDIKRRAD